MGHNEHGEVTLLSFVIIDHEGKTHRIAMDKIEGQSGQYIHRGDVAKLFRRWPAISTMIEYKLKDLLK